MTFTIEGMEYEVNRIAHLPEKQVIRVFLKGHSPVILDDEAYDEAFITYSAKFKKKVEETK